MYEKYVISGKIVEYYKFSKDKTYVVGSKRQVRRASKNRFRRRDNVQQFEKSFRRLVWSNLTGNEHPAIVTLTMLTVCGIGYAYRCFSAYVARLRREIGNFRYVAVPEFQKRGAVHFHLLVWGLPRHILINERITRYLQRQWLYGFVDCIETDGNVRIVRYLSKYMSKSVRDPRLCGQKAFVSSRNSLRPVFLKTATEVSYIDEIVPVDNLVLDSNFECETMWLGRLNYKKYHYE